MGQERDAFWVSESNSIVLIKTVISRLGEVIRRDYRTSAIATVARDKDFHVLTDGDLGLEVRVDRGKLRAMSVEQRILVVWLLQKMIARLLVALGVDTHDSFERDMVVEAKVDGEASFRAVIVRQTDSSLMMLRCVDPESGMAFLRHVPLHQCMISEVPNAMSGIDGLRQCITWETYHHSRSRLEPWMLEHLPASDSLFADLVRDASLKQEVRIKALARIQGQATIDELARDPANLWRIVPADLLIGRINDERLLMDVANSRDPQDQERGLPEAAVARLTNLGGSGLFFLSAIASLPNARSEAREAAIAAIPPEHQGELAQIVRIIQRRIESDTLAAEEQKTETLIRNAAFEALRDPDQLEQIMREDFRDDMFQARLAQKLEELRGPASASSSASPDAL